jgi:hypothetical protein
MVATMLRTPLCARRGRATKLLRDPPFSVVGELPADSIDMEFRNQNKKMQNAFPVGIVVLTPL